MRFFLLIFISLNIFISSKIIEGSPIWNNVKRDFDNLSKEKLDLDSDPRVFDSGIKVIAGVGYTRWKETLTVMKYEDISNKHFTPFLQTLAKILEIKDEFKEDFYEGFMYQPEEHDVFDLDFLFNDKKGSKLAFVLIFYQQSENGTFDFLIGKGTTEVKLQADTYLVRKSKRSWFGLRRRTWYERQVVERVLTEKQKMVLNDYFHINCIQEIASILGMKKTQKLLR